MTVNTMKIVSMLVKAIRRLSKKRCVGSLERMKMEVTFPTIPKTPNTI